MSDFKFACPVCGQHITCDSGSSGSQMDCPTCFRKLVVPQAPAPGSTAFVLTASLVQKQVIPSLSNAKSQPALVPEKKFPVVPVVIGVLVLVAALAAALVFFRQSKPTPQGIADDDQSTNTLASLVSTNTQPAVILARPAPDATNWTLNVSGALIPDTAASGSVNGFGFKLDRATIQEGRLDLRQGTAWPPDVGVSIHLLAKRIEDIAGRTVMIETTRTNAPRLILRWLDERGKAKTKEFRTGYAARIEFGAVTGNKIAGKIFLAASDDAHSYIAGTFTAEVRKPSKPKKQP